MDNVLVNFKNTITLQSICLIYINIVTSKYKKQIVLINTIVDWHNECLRLQKKNLLCTSESRREHHTG